MSSDPASPTAASPTAADPTPAGSSDAGEPAVASGDGSATGETFSPIGSAPSDPRRANSMSTADYELAIHPRAQLARKRGLAAPYIPGGRDPDIAETTKAERPYVRLLVLMVVIIVGGGFVFTIAGLIATGGK